MMHRSKIISIVALLLFLFVFFVAECFFCGKEDRPTGGHNRNISKNKAFMIGGNFNGLEVSNVKIEFQGGRIAVQNACVICLRNDF